MAERITKAEVVKVARLARLELTGEEIERFSTQLAAILDHVAMLERLDTRDVPPTAQAIRLEAPMREDEARPGLGRDDAAAPAPAWEEGCFAVPRIIAGDEK
ncbi:MAG: Asp-tRNA(Asn)/Glu-tRNA(Gln) amidotransferase subunit GatC [Deltaproteobacteria bacterium]|nr:Asp-tRNA(Asn)/Glu-tRNA(Gln) amidotransferase subunit GatC [Deltaproteobacteria bacterium]